MKHTTPIFRSTQLWLLIFFFISFNANAIEVYKNKASSSSGPDKYKQYSMTRTNADDGFIYAGTTKNANGDDNIHVIKTDNTFTTTWSFMYSEVNDHHLHATGICKMRNGNGYWLSGYWRDGVGDILPFIMEIDENGSVVRHIMGEQNGVFLDIADTEDHGCVATGFLSEGINEPEPNSRRGVLVKFDDTLGVQWSNAFHAQFRSNLDNWHYEVGENVTVINNAGTNYQDYYFVSGAVSDIAPIPQTSAPNLFYMFVDNSGGLIYKHTTCMQACAYDVTYDEADNKIYLIGKLDFVSDYYGLVNQINLSTGVLDYQIRFEGAPYGFPYAHTPIPYKIEVSGDYLTILGHVRIYHFSGPLIDDIMIPFRMQLNKSDTSDYYFSINHTDSSHTLGYPSEDPGFLHAWENYIGNFASKLPAVYTPEIGITFINNEENPQWGMVGYFDQTGGSIRYDLHFISSDNGGECNPYEENLLFQNLAQRDIETIYVNATFTLRRMTIAQNTMGMNDTSCE